MSNISQGLWEYAEDVYEYYICGGDEMANINRIVALEANQQVRESYPMGDNFSTTQHNGAVIYEFEDSSDFVKIGSYRVDLTATALNNEQAPKEDFVEEIATTVYGWSELAAEEVYEMINR